MVKERIESGGKRIEIVDWGEQTKYYIELHKVRNPYDNLVRKATRLMGNTLMYTYDEEGISLLHAKQKALGHAENYANITRNTYTRYKIKVLPINYFLVLQG